MAIRERYSQIHMGVQVVITCYAVDRDHGDAACRAAFSRFAELDAMMSDYRPSSELNRLCAKAGRGPVEVSRDLFAVLAMAQEVAGLSDGAFDVTCGPLVRLWRDARESGTVPRESALEEARAKTGFTKLILNRDASTVELVEPGMQLDLGGIGKGYACDHALVALTAHGVTAAMVEAGGDIALSEAPPDHDGWKIGILGSPETLSLRNRAVSTSGDTEQHLDANGVRFSHVIDPRTGYGLTSRVQATVVAPDAMTSDCLSKLCGMIGPEQAEPVLERYGATVAAILTPA
ncbi:MAG TPA: FAD:protein FMN transferase [Fimbriimonadaceae bacterium]|nr:FAD:protein FMN transferase [Fimbriimonadaceae bacterium]